MSVHPQIVVFSKNYSPEGRVCKAIVESHKGLTHDRYEWINFDRRTDCPQVEDFLWKLSGMNNREVPLLFIKRRFRGGYYEILRLEKQGVLQRLFDKLCLDRDDEDEDLEEAEREALRQQLLVRLTPLDETEVTVKVADWLTLSPEHVDFDVFRDSESETALTSGMQVVPKSQTRVLKVQDRVDEEDPEWIYVGGTQRHRSSIVGIRLEESSASSLFLKKQSVSQAAINKTPTPTSGPGSPNEPPTPSE